MKKYENFTCLLGLVIRKVSFAFVFAFGTALLLMGCGDSSSETDDLAFEIPADTEYGATSARDSTSAHSNNRTEQDNQAASGGVVISNDPQRIGPYQIDVAVSYDPEVEQAIYQCKVLDERDQMIKQWSHRLANNGAFRHELPVDPFAASGPLGGFVTLHFLDGGIRCSGFIMGQGQENHHFDFAQSVEGHQTPKWPKAFIDTLDASSVYTPASLREIVRFIDLPTKDRTQWFLGEVKGPEDKIETMVFAYQTRVLQDRVVFEYRFFVDTHYKEFSQAHVAKDGQLLKVAFYSSGGDWSAYTRSSEWPDGSVILTEYFKKRDDPHEHLQWSHKLTHDRHWAYPAALDPILFAYHIKQGHTHFSTASYASPRTVLLSHCHRTNQTSRSRLANVPADALALQVTNGLWPIGDPNAPDELTTNQLILYVDAAGQLLAYEGDYSVCQQSTLQEAADAIGMSPQQLGSPMPDPPAEPD